MIECKIVCEKDGESHMYTLFNDAHRQYNYYALEETPMELAEVEKRYGTIVSIEKNFGKLPWVDTGFLVDNLHEGRINRGEQDV